MDRQVQGRQALPDAATQLMPVRMIEAARQPATRNARERSSASAAVTSGAIEIEIGAPRVKLRGAVDAEQLRVVFAALGAGR
jgi:hypothetical protein